MSGLDEIIAKEATPASPSVGRPVWSAVAVVGGYCALGVVAYWPVLPGISRKVFSNVGDFTQAVWFIAWVPHALAHGLNPFFSNAMFAPHGVNLASNTSSPFLGLLTTPLAPFLSPLVIGNLLLVVSMPLSATAAFVVLRKWRVWCLAAAIGGLIYGFSPYMVGQGTGHPELVFVPLPPLIALTVFRVLQGDGRRWRLGVRLGLLVIIQYLISPEVLAITVVSLFVACVCVAIHNRSMGKSIASAAVGPVAIALGCCILIAYPLWMLLAGPQHFTGPAWPLLNRYHNDVLGLIDHGTLQRVSLGMQSSWAGRIAIGGIEDGGYIGIPVLILTGLLAWKSRRSPRMQLSVVIFVVSAVLSLGPYLSIHGRVTHIPLPFIFLYHVPLLNDILPSRLSFALDTCLAAIIAFALDDIRRTDVRNTGAVDGDRRWEWTQGRKAVTTSAVILVALSTTLLPRWPNIKEPAVLLPSSLRLAIPSGDPVAITYPYVYGQRITAPLLWQAEDGFRFRITGGYGYHPDRRGRGTLVPSSMDPPQLQMFLASAERDSRMKRSPINSRLLAATKIALSRYDVRLVIVDRAEIGVGPVMTLFRKVLGSPTISVDDFSMWTGGHGPLRG